MKQSLNTLWGLVALLTLGSATECFADRPTISARFSKECVEVGDRVEYILDIEKDRATEIGIPDFEEHLTDDEQKERTAAKQKMSSYTEYDDDIFEYIDSSLDTIKVEGRRLHLRKSYKLAVMETGNINILPSILYFEKNRELPDTIYAADSITLHVARYEQYDTTAFLVADPTSQEGYKVDSLRAAQHLRSEGIATQKNLPFIFAEIRDYVTYSAIGIILLGFVVWLAIVIIRRYLRNRKERVVLPPAIPPHVVANKALVELSHRKLWQNGKFKQYYTHLTAILRVYISGRWQIGALEMTTDEIIEALRDVELSYESRRDLVAILRTADMVKFAKAQPDAEQNEMNYTRAYYFVENTKEQSEEHNVGKQEITIETKIHD